ncbi:MAG: hypothetical protein MI806_34280 [Minwuiales bacterium]|nr:hypothetical protein [Minwuiales bacterium]
MINLPKTHKHMEIWHWRLSDEEPFVGLNVATAADGRQYATWMVTYDPDIIRSWVEKELYAAQIVAESFDDHPFDVEPGPGVRLQWRG